MGYTTEFMGRFDLNKRLDPETHKFLTKLSQTRRMKRNVGPKYGVEGEFYVDGAGLFGQGEEPNIIDFNHPPSTQPSLWCDWVPTKDGLHIEWNGAEKFYHYVEWLRYIIDKILQPKGYVLNGDVRWQGEEESDKGHIIVVNNSVVAVDQIIYNKAVDLVGKPLARKLKKGSSWLLLVDLPGMEAFVESSLKNTNGPVRKNAKGRKIVWQ